MVNTGNKIYATLEEYNVVTGVATGDTKPNVIGDPDYVPPVFDTTTCPLPPIVEDDNNKIKLQVKNEGTQFINLSSLLLKPWNATLPSQNYYNDVLSASPGQIQNFINPEVQQIGDWLNASIAAGNFSKGWSSTIEVYFTNSDGRALKHTFTIAPNTGATQNLISIPRTAAGGINLIELIIKDIPGPGPIPNTPPTAEAGPNQTVTLPTTVQLAGSGVDTDGTIISYQWARVSGPLSYTFNDSTLPNAVLSDLVAGTYIFRLTVTDNLGAIGQDIVTITVNPIPNNPNGVVVVLVDSALSSSAITQVKLNNVNLLTAPVTSSNSPKATSFLKGTYDIEVTTTGVGGSIRINQGSTPTICQNYAAAGTYVFHNCVVDEGVNGLTISLSNAVCSDQGTPVYVKMITSNIQTIEEATAPWGKRVRISATIEAKFYSDSGGTTPISASVVLNYKLTTVDNLTSLTTYVNNYTEVIGQTAILIGGDTSLEEWDYSLNNPTLPEDPADKIKDADYTYQLLPGIGYIVIP